MDLKIRVAPSVMSLLQIVPWPPRSPSLMPRSISIGIERSNAEMLRHQPETETSFSSTARVEDFLMASSSTTPENEHGRFQRGGDYQCHARPR